MPEEDEKPKLEKLPRTIEPHVEIGKAGGRMRGEGEMKYGRIIIFIKPKRFSFINVFPQNPLLVNYTDSNSKRKKNNNFSSFLDAE